MPRSRYVRSGIGRRWDVGGNADNEDDKKRWMRWGREEMDE